MSYLYLFILFMEFSRQDYWSGLPFPSPVDHILSKLSTMTVALHGQAHCFIELDKPAVHVIRLVSFLWLWFHSGCLLMGKDKRLMEVSWWERLTERELGLILKEMGIPDHLTCLLRNLYAVQEATFRIRHGTMGCLQIGKGVRQGCILSPCLFNLHPQYII